MLILNALIDNEQFPEAAGFRLSDFKIFRDFEVITQPIQTSRRRWLWRDRVKNRTRRLMRTQPPADLAFFKMWLRDIVPLFVRHLRASPDWARVASADVFYGADLFWGGVIALHIAQASGARFILDFKELFSEMYAAPSPAVQTLLVALEEKILDAAWLAPCVSQSIIDFYAARYPAQAHKFILLENASRYEPLAVDFNRTGKVKLILSLGALPPERGCRELLRIWERLSPANAELHIRTKHVSPKEKDVLETLAGISFARGSVRFVPPVLEDRMKEALLDYDIGVIPYLSEANLNHRYCCPNKFGQYLNAGLALFCSDTEYITPRITAHGLGAIYNPHDEEGAAEKLRALIDDRASLNAMRRRAHEFAKADYRWDKVVEPLLTRLTSA